MTKNRNLKRRIRIRASKTGEAYTSARRLLIPANRSTSVLETRRPADYLLRAAGSAAGQAYKAAAIELLGAEPDSVILDLGCGTGGELEPLLDAIGPNGSVIGVDHDEAALDTARAHHSDTRLRLILGEAHSLEALNASVDRVYVDRTMQHVDTPATVIGEVARVLRPGGRVVFAEPDWQTLLVDHPELEISESYRRFVTERVIRNPRIGSELPRLTQHAGLELGTVIPVTATYTDAVDADRILGFARVTSRAVAARYLSRDQADRWLGYLSGGVFFASLTIFITAARVPKLSADR